MCRLNADQGSSVLLCASLLAGADIHGTIVIERKLTRHSVTASAGMYERGVSVELGADAEEDPLAFERSHVAVYIEGAPSPAPFEAAKASIEQKDRRFVPDLVVIPAGSTVSFPNFDPIFHNVFSLSPAKSFDLGNYSKGQTRAVTFGTPGIVAVYCHLHSNMAATILVTPNRWATQADGNGSFVLRNVPAGVALDRGHGPVVKFGPPVYTLLQVNDEYRHESTRNGGDLVCRRILASRSK